MKNTRKFISLVLVFLMVLTMCVAALSVHAADQGLASQYKTNPNGPGKQKTITVDGDISDWDSSMVIAQGAANDDPRVYRENPGTGSSTELTVNAKSNIFNSKSTVVSDGTDKITVKYDLKSAMKVVNAQWTLNYDSSKLRLNSVSMPNVSGSTKTNTGSGVAYGNYTTTTPDDFTSSKTLVEAEFSVLSKGTANVNLNVEELSVGYMSGSVLKNETAVKGGTKQNLGSVSGFSSNNISGAAAFSTGGSTTPGSTTVLKVNATSNFFPSASANVQEGTTRVTVTYKFSSTMDLLNSQWEMSYDTSKLSLVTALKNLMPNVTGFSASETTKGLVKGNFSDIDLVEFKNEQAFVTAAFDVVGSGSTTVNLNVKTIGISTSDNQEAYIVDKYVVKDVTSVPGFSGEKYTKNTIVDAGGYVMGDVDGNGTINVVDATLVQKKAAGLIEFDDRQMIVADVDGNGIINVVDATQIQKYSAGIIHSFS